MTIDRSAAGQLRDTRASVAHLVRRVGFGAPAEEIDALADLGYEGAVEALCDLAAPDPAADAVTPPAFNTAAYLAARRGDEAARQEAARTAAAEGRALPVWWLQRMAASDRPMREKLTLLWHDHFATSLGTVKVAQLMFNQRQVLYELGHGRFDALVHALARDAAMLIWLDGRDNQAGAPNENFARELLELFTLGHGTVHGSHHQQPYTEDDVASAARALTGWRVTQTGGSVLVPGRHDAGTKRLLGTTGPLDLDAVVEIVTTHPACAPHVVARLWSRLARPATADDATVRELAAAFAADLDISGLLRRMLLHPAFVAPATRGALVKTPIDYVIGIARALRINVDERALPLLAGLGQVPFLPPDVSGWPANEAWLSTGTALLRLQLAVHVAQRVDAADAIGSDPAAWPAALERLLTVDSWGTVTTAALVSAPDAPTALTLALVAPEHLVA